jgi:uncharacterized protein (TIRG00374 family)
MKGSFAGMWGTLSSCDMKFLFLSAILLIINVGFLSYRLKIIFVGENLIVNFKEAVQLTVMGYFFNNFMPTAVGGDIIKAYIASIRNKQKLKSYASVMMDRFIGLYTFLLVAAIALFIDRGRVESPIVRPLVLVLIFVGAVSFFVVTNSTIANMFGKLFRRLKMLQLGEKLNEVLSIIQDYRNRKRIVAEAFIVSLVSQTFFFLVMYTFFLALGSPVSLGNIFLIMPVVTFISMIPSLGGLGVREGAIVALFMPIVGKEASFAASILLLFGFLMISVVGGIICLLNGLGVLKVAKESEGMEG